MDEPTNTLNGPMTHNAHAYDDTSFRCHDFAAATPSVTVVAGETLDLTWNLAAAHPGDCSLWLSYP